MMYEPEDPHAEFCLQNGIHWFAELIDERTGTARLTPAFSSEEARSKDIVLYDRLQDLLNIAINPTDPSYVESILEMDALCRIAPDWVLNQIIDMLQPPQRGPVIPFDRKLREQKIEYWARTLDRINTTKGKSLLGNPRRGSLEPALRLTDAREPDGMPGIAGLTV